MDLLIGDGSTVLYVDDEPDLLATAAEVLERENPSLSVETATNPATALDRLDETAGIDCVVSDYQMPEMDGLAFLDAVREHRPDVPFILFTGKGSEEIASEAISAGVTDYIQKEGGIEQFTVLANRIQHAVDQRRARRELERTKHRYQTLVRESSDVIIVAEPDGTLRYVSPAAERVFGFEPSDLVGASVFDMIHPETRDQVRSALDEVLDDPAAEPTIEVRSLRGDGTCILVEAEGRNLLDDEVIDGIAIYARDVTERAERERELERYEKIVETAGDAAQVIDREGRYVMVNDALVERTGYDRAELLESTPRLVLGDAGYQRASEELSGVLDAENRDFAKFEVTVQPADGDHYPAEARIAPIVEDGEFRGSVGISREITERKRRERELERQNERLSEFAGVVSHDLRNPLNVAQARTELAREDPVDEHIEAIADALDRMERLVEDLLTLAREGRTVQDPEPFALERIAREAWDSVETAEATLSVTGDETLTGDRARVRQVFENLFGNSVEHGGPAVSVTVGPLDAGGFYVADDGSGLEGVDSVEIFEPNVSTTEDGTGLGLAIARDIVEAHGWEIVLAEWDAEGLRFEVRESPADDLLEDSG